MNGKSLRVLAGEIKTPPMSEAARREVGFLLEHENGRETTLGSSGLEGNDRAGVPEPRLPNI